MARNRRSFSIGWIPPNGVLFTFTIKLASVGSQVLFQVSAPWSFILSTTTGPPWCFFTLGYPKLKDILNDWSKN
jgi:hypothetical protein